MTMRIHPVDHKFGRPKPFPPSFLSYQSPLKDAFKCGALGDNFIGIYGVKLNKDNVSLEHIIPVKQKGKTVLSNLLLADRDLNAKRGSQDIGKFVTIGMLRNYLKQFKDVKCKDFNGNEYIRLIRNTFKKLVDKE